MDDSASKDNELTAVRAHPDGHLGSRGLATRNLSLRVTERTYAELARLTPAGETISGVARRVLEHALRQAGMPSLVPEKGPRVVSMDWAPVMEAMAAAEGRQSELLEEVLRAVLEADFWARNRLVTKGSMDQQARDDSERELRRWKRSVGR